MGIEESMLVEPDAVDDDAVLDHPDRAQRRGHERPERGVEDADDDVLRARGVGHGPEDVERGAHAERLAHRHDVLHRRVEPRREHERDPRVGEAAAQLKDVVKSCVARPRGGIAKVKGKRQNHAFLFRNHYCS